MRRRILRFVGILVVGFLVTLFINSCATTPALKKTEIQEKAKKEEKTVDVEIPEELAKKVVIKAEEERKMALASTEEKPEVFPQLGHNSQVNSVAFSPGGRYILSGSGDSALKLWEVATGKEIRTFAGHSNWVRSVAFSPDGKYALSGSDDKTIKLWNVETGKEIKTFSGHTGAVSSVAFSPDGRYILSGSGDKTIKLWNVETGKEIKTFSGHTGAVNSVAFSPDGRYILSGSDDKTLKLWDISTGKEIKTFSGHTHIVKSVALSPDGRYVLSGSWDKTLRLWDISTGKKIKTFSGHTDLVFSVAFSPDGKYALSGSVNITLKLWEVAIWEVSTGKEIRQFSGHTAGGMFSVAFSPNGKYALSSGILWDVATGNKIRQFSGHANIVKSVSFSHDSRYVLSGSWDKTLKLWEVAIWEASTGKEIRQFTGHTNSVYSESFRPDGEVAFSPDSRYALGIWDKTLKLWDIETGREIKTFTGHTDIVSSVAFSPNGRYALSSSWDDTLKLWDISTGKEIRQFSGHTGGIYSVTFSPNGRYALSSGGSVATLKLWDIVTGKEIRQFTTGYTQVYSVAFSPDGRYALGSWGNTLKLWEVATGKGEIRTFSGHTALVTSVAFSPDGQYALSGSRDNTLKLWNISTGREIRTFMGHTSTVNSVAFSPDGKYALSGSEDGTTRIWDVSTGKEIAQMVGFIDGEWIVITPEGYFNTSKNGAAHLNVRMGNSVYGLDQFYDVFYRPDIVELVFKGEDISQIAPLNLEDALKNPPPIVEFVSLPPKETSDKKVTIKYKITSAGGGIGDIRIFHNGKLIQSEGFYKEAVRLTPQKTKLASLSGDAIRGQLRGIAIKGKAEAIPIISKPKDKVYEGTIEVDAVSGENEISIAAFNESNTVQSVMKTAGFNAKIPPEDSHLYILAVGIDQYKDSVNNLNYAVKDAESISDKIIAQAATIYKPQNIHITLIKNTEATKVNIQNMINELSKAIKLTDTFIMFVASHGILNGGLYSIITHDFDGELSPDKLINSNEIMELSKNIRSLNQLFILDTCHAGGLDNFLSGLYDARMTVLARNMGLHMYASASSTEEAMDGYKGNGLFTYTLLDGLNNKREADKNRDKRVSIIELGEYSKVTTTEISKSIGHKQTPLIINFGKDNTVYNLK